MPAEHQFNDRLIRFPELEKIFGVCKRTVRRRAENGELPPLRHIGRAVGMLESQVKAYFQKLSQPSNRKEHEIWKPESINQNDRRTASAMTARLYRARVKLAGDSKVRDIALQVSDKQVAQQKLNKLIQELEHESAGLIPAKAEREAAQSPLLDLVSEYVNELTVLGRSGDHLRHVDKRLRRLVRECRLDTIGRRDARLVSNVAQGASLQSSQDPE